MANHKFGTAHEESASSDDASVARSVALQAPGDVSGSTDALAASRSVLGAAGAESSTSTDAALFTQGRTGVEASTSADSIASLVQTSARFPSEVSESGDGVIHSFTRADIADYEFVLVDPVTNTMNPFVPFGGSQAISGKFAPGGFEVADQDQSAVLGDYRMFGTDRHAPPTWAWSLFTQSETPADALDWYDVFKSVWDNKVRNSPEQVLALRYQVAGRTRRVHGRPRRITPVYDDLRIGKIRIECDMALSEDVYYDEAENAIQAGLSAAGTSISAGIILPQALPWHFTQPATPVTKQAIITGSESTWIDVDFYGPSVNPWVKIGNLTWGLVGSLDLGQKVTLSGKPWNMGVWRNDGTNLPGLLDPRARLSALQISPGTYSVQYGAWDSTGNSYVVLRWRNAYQSL
jgi:hypothetical protein